jgi:hypothetical protein
MAFILTVFALVYSNKDVREAQLRLKIPGLLAELFVKPHAERPAESAKELFAESEASLRSRVGLGRTAAGGWSYDVWR